MKYDIYRVHTQYISQMLNTYGANSIVFETECRQCLRKPTVENRKDEYKMTLTVLLRKLLAKYLTPSSSISLS
jgi:hypothetical protein